MLLRASRQEFLRVEQFHLRRGLTGRKEHLMKDLRVKYNNDKAAELGSTQGRNCQGRAISVSLYSFKSEAIRESFGLPLWGQYPKNP